MPIQFNEDQFNKSYKLPDLPHKMSPPPSYFKKVAAVNSEYINNCDPILSVDHDEPFAPPMPNACNVPVASLVDECDGDCADEQAPNNWIMKPCGDLPPQSSLKGLFVFHIHVGQADSEKAIGLMKMVQTRYKSVEDRLRENGYEVMWLPTRSDSRSELFPTP